VIITSLAGPVTNSLGSWGQVSTLVSWLAELGGVLVGGGGVFFTALSGIPFGLLGNVILDHVLWFAVSVVIGLSFLAPEALLPALEVVVLALVALPTAIWEVEGGILLG